MWLHHIFRSGEQNTSWPQLYKAQKLKPSAAAHLSCNQCPQLPPPPRPKGSCDTATLHALLQHGLFLTAHCTGTASEWMERKNGKRQKQPCQDSSTKAAGSSSRFCNKGYSSCWQQLARRNYVQLGSGNQGNASFSNMTFTHFKRFRASHWW